MSKVSVNPVQDNTVYIILKGKAVVLNNDEDKAAILFETYADASEYCEKKYGFKLKVKERRNSKGQLIAQILTGV